MLYKLGESTSKGNKYMSDGGHSPSTRFYNPKRKWFYFALRIKPSVWPNDKSFGVNGYHKISANFENLFFNEIT